MSGPQPTASQTHHTLRQQLEAASETLLARDLARLRQTLSRAGARFDAERFRSDLQRGLAAAAARQALLPTQFNYPAELPVSANRVALLDAIAHHPLLIVCGETGSGKTTQLPKLCLELGRGRRGLIGHTQPRRLAARSVAQRIAQELDSPLGQRVGYETRFDRRLSEQTLVKLMTDGILLAELQTDRDWLAYDTLIIDEAHERSLNIDFLLGRIRQLLPQRPDLKVIITSATLDPERLSRHFNDAPIFKVEGRTYPVEIRWREEQSELELEDQVAAAVDELWGDGRRAPDGDILVFLPGEREIRELAKRLGGRFPRAEVLPLYSRLPVEQQDRVFGSSRAARIVLATNVAETSVTVPGIRYVIDTGSARINRFNPRLGVQQLQIERISQAAANQRSGRCGRLGPGVAIRLYAADDFASRPLFTDPEILRSNLAGVILQMAALKLGDIDEFDWVEPPENRHVAEGYRLLQALGALDDDRRLTAQGRELARLPLDPRIARMVLAARGRSCEAAVRIIAAALSVQDPHETPLEQQTQARQKHALWRDPGSDFLTLLKLWRRWLGWSAEGSNRALRKLCREHYVSYLRMEEWESVHRQINDLLGGALTLPAEAADEAAAAADNAELHKVLLAGLIDHIGVKQTEVKKGERPDYQGPRGRRFRVFPGSALAKKPPQWLMCAQLVQTSQLFARVAAEVQPDWLAEVGAHLIKSTVTHPLWNAERGEVQCSEFQSLYGLQLLKRTRHYGSIDPVAARQIFIREGLVAGQWPGKPRFLTHNLKLIAEVQDKEARLRRPDLLADDDQLYGFYDARIPADVCTAATLKRWLRHASSDKGDPGKLLEMTEADVLRPGADADIGQQFPDHLDIGGHRLALSYRHDPGVDADGVSFHVPLALLFQLPEAAFDWLVPGLRAARVEGLLRALPMKLRRLCTPAADYANAIAARMDPTQGSFNEQLLLHLRTLTGAPIAAADLEPERLPAHLRPRLLLIDERGQQIGESDGLVALQAAHQGLARQALNRVVSPSDPLAAWRRSALTQWNFGDLPDSVPLGGGALAYPALTAEADGSVALQLLESPQACMLAHRLGVRRLLLLQLPDRLKDLVRSTRSRLGMALIGLQTTPEMLAMAIAERAAELSWPLQTLRSEAAFKEALQHRGEFGRRANAMLDDVLGWFSQGAELRRQLRALDGRWAESARDIEQQLDSLLAPGLIGALPEAQWSRVQVWLRGIDIRLQRLPNKPAKDLDALAQLASVRAQLPGPWHAARWLLEEWRIALFAQELKAQGSPGAARIVGLINGPL